MTETPQNTSKIILTNNQQRAFDSFQRFILDENQRVFILKGYAGSGKTTLVRYFLDEVGHQGISYVLMASTGRAAKILSDLSGIGASTIHSVIYNFSNFSQDLEEIARLEDELGVDTTGQLFLNFKLTPIDTINQFIYFVDEASMISDVEDKTATQAKFGSGKLLSDLLNYDKKGKFVFVGDECQLPPVQQDISPALCKEYFGSQFNIQVTEATLTEIVRQQKDNSIITASHQLRKLYEIPPTTKWGKLPLRNHEHIKLYTDEISFINNYLELIINKDFHRATFISRTNKKCNHVNSLVRKALGMKDKIQKGDLLLVTQNNLLSNLVNGDLVVVEQIGNVRHQRCGLTFLQTEVRDLVSNKYHSLLLIEDILYSGSTNLSQIQQKALYVDFFRRMREQNTNLKTDELKELMLYDEYLNALRCVFGYALTCHKAQGGEWDDVFLDMPRNFTLNANAYTYQWAYTAVTRAKKQLHIVDDFYIT